jgi:hypothetical protein
MSISLIHPSRGRPKKSYETARYWIDHSGLDIKDIDYILSLDSDDPQLSQYYIEWDCEIINPNTSVVEAVNNGAKEAKGDILVYLSDDFKCPDNWGQLILKEFEGVTSPRILKIDDKLQDFHVRVLTMPIMNRAAYEQLGYFFNPLYKSMWVDCDLYETAYRRGWIKPCPHLIFPHEHVSNGMAPDDETYRRSAANWDQGKAVFEQRKRMRFV